VAGVVPVAGAVVGLAAVAGGGGGSGLAAVAGLAADLAPAGQALRGQPVRAPLDSPR